ncbi:hypothetical protein P5673_005428 [Acropora cervicornis]|uniref:Uncharacterized protein n=1 Tax=Acropora cervicornis TaxID=6130 RepID=A0AAD9QYU9_ACRCE|nr:hypothetical protein P5673_005428 [Acropora cervicornis]
MLVAGDFDLLAVLWQVETMDAWLFTELENTILVDLDCKNPRILYFPPSEKSKTVLPGFWNPSRAFQPSPPEVMNSCRMCQSFLPPPYSVPPTSLEIQAKSGSKEGSFKLALESRKLPFVEKLIPSQMFHILWEWAREIREYFADHELLTHGLVDPNVPCPWTTKMGLKTGACLAKTHLAVKSRQVLPTLWYSAVNSKVRMNGTGSYSSETLAVSKPHVLVIHVELNRSDKGNAMNWAF